MGTGQEKNFLDPRRPLFNCAYIKKQMRQSVNGLYLAKLRHLIFALRFFLLFSTQKAVLNYPQPSLIHQEFNGFSPPYARATLPS